MKRKLLIGLLGLLGALIILVIYFALAVLITPPEIANKAALELKVTKSGNDFYACDGNWLKKSKTGLWEMYVEGSPYKRGVMIGKLTEDLAAKQEDYFISQIQSMIPSAGYLGFLKYFVAWFNRDLDTHIKDEYKEEIYGISTYASEKYSHIGPRYQRILNYHAAHDIGHFLQEKNLVVGCTSFSAWGTKSEDSSLIIGRNFDFYVGDKFAENKIVAFTNPDKGYKFMTITWAGMIGAVSGMNEKGLCLTINAAKSDIPTHSATPIAILAREILQYAKNIDEAYAIAKARKTFVAQSIMIGSSEDNRTSIIEKSPKQIGLYSSDTNFIICANHFQSEELKNEPLNVEHIKESTSMFRYQRMSQLVNRYPQINISNTAEILRNRRGFNEKNIGLGNEKGLNHLLAHHSIIFKPSQLMFWISTNPYQLGEYVAYDFKKVFDKHNSIQTTTEITEEALHIPVDSFMYSEEFKGYNRYRVLLAEIKGNKKIESISESKITELISANPEFYNVYAVAGDYYKAKEENAKAASHYKIALSKEIPWANDEKKIRSNLVALVEKQ
ncbi:MAG TPA: C45 family peptidase [Cytophagaceae bacterium]|jgi:predicted choloylglycine hydrolase